MNEANLSKVVWRKSSRSQPTQSDCVEIAHVEQGLFVRDSKNPGGGHLILNTVAWNTLLARIKQGSYDFSGY